MTPVNGRQDPLREASEPIRSQQNGIGPGSQAALGETLGVERVVKVLQRRKWWVIYSILFMTLTIVILTSRQEKQYTATASLLFGHPATSVLNNSGAVDPTREAATNLSLVGLPAVAARAATIAKNGTTS